MADRIVMYSGGALSWAAAMRTIERHGRDGVRLLFTDTSMEDEDLYRFLDDSEKQLGVELVRIKDGRTPWDVYRDKRMIGNTRFDPCSAELKRKLGHRWLADNAPDATLVFGIDWTEMHRLDGLRPRYGDMGHPVEAPMCDAPWMHKGDVLRWMRREGLEPPRLYAMGFAHNNCGGFCCRAGQGHFAHLLATMPERYAFHEAKEQEMRDFLGKDVSILRDRADGTTDPITLREFRLQIEAADHGQANLFDFEIGGCGCFLDEEVDA
jgi:3'-phosphoadenosine 5'-phosphosulfate sulfotransferase (PAPS reductase)/FAD synthetase